MTKATGKPRGRPAKVETVIERAVKTALAPKTVKRGLGVQMRGYDAGGNGRRMAGWNPRSTSPKTVADQAPKIRERARDSTRNDWATASITQKWTTSLVGIGITPRWKRISDKTKRKLVVDTFAKWAKDADADGVYDYYGLTTLAVRTWFDGGECFGRKRARFTDEGLALPFQIQLLEADMVPIDLYSTARDGLPVGNEIKQGIEFNKRGKRIAYWVFKDHPSDDYTTFTNEPLVRVAASEMFHMFEPKRPGQIRGISESAPILTRLRNVADYEDATLERQKLANMFVAFLTHQLPEVDPLDLGLDPLGSGADADLTTASGAPILGLQPGLFQELGEGEKVEFSNPPEAGTTYSDYMRTTHLGTASGSGLPYELMSGDIVNVSDRTLRVMINEFRRLAEQRQWQIVIPMMCQQIIDWFAQLMVITGVVAEADYDDVSLVEHAPHGWSYIHPVQDPQGKILEITGGLTSRSAAVSSRGDDIEAVDAERAVDDKREQTLKIGAYSQSVKDAAAASKPAAPAPSPAPAPAPAAPAAAPAARLEPAPAPLETPIAAMTLALMTRQMEQMGASREEEDEAIERINALLGITQ